MKHSFLDDMQASYLEAAFFTDTDDIENPEFTKLFQAQAYFACVRFEDAARYLDINLRDLYSADQLGHDLWFTRNRHGVGFWDRPEVYGDHKDIFTAFARAQGEHDVEFEVTK